jgi:endogenous inhibitor of DNA gyrase (YacG/DUF329 family)
MVTMPACPICKSAARRHPDNPHAPFCSERCKLIDLGNWLGESYRFDDTTPPAPPRRGGRLN